MIEVLMIPNLPRFLGRHMSFHLTILCFFLIVEGVPVKGASIFVKASMIFRQKAIEPHSEHWEAGKVSVDQDKLSPRGIVLALPGSHPSSHFRFNRPKSH